LECCVKNCGQLVHDEVGTKPFMEQIRETIKTTPHENVKNKLLELLQTWAFAFRAIPKYCAVQVVLTVRNNNSCFINNYNIIYLCILSKKKYCYTYCFILLVWFFSLTGYS